MKTITPFELQILIDQCDVELIDVRPAEDFHASHALLARSTPFSHFEPHSILAHRILDRRSPIYIMSPEMAVGSLAACSLASAGLAEPVVVEGGIEGWEGQCLPMVRNEFTEVAERAAPKPWVSEGLTFALSAVLQGIVFMAAFAANAVAAVSHALRSRKMQRA